MNSDIDGSPIRRDADSTERLLFLGAVISVVMDADATAAPSR